VTEGNSADRRFYRNRVSNGAVCVLCAFFVVVFLVLALEAIEKSDGAALVIIGFILCGVFLVPALREPFHGVVATSTEVKIRNILRTHMLSWNEIERFELARYDPWPRIGVAVLKAGRRVPMVGIQAARRSRLAEETISALNQELIARTAHEDASVTPSQAAPPA
jgi:hypothetical protein